MPSPPKQPSLLFTDAFQITRTPADDWFGVRLNTDTDLFVDPFLVFDDSDPAWSDAEDEVIAFFNEVLGLVATAGGSKQHKDYRAAGKMLSFPEPAEFCLGFGANTIFGRGPGRDLGQLMLKAAGQAVQAGINGELAPGSSALTSNPARTPSPSVDLTTPSAPSRRSRASAA